jgi:hypothetical protein
MFLTVPVYVVHICNNMPINPRSLIVVTPTPEGNTLELNSCCGWRPSCQCAAVPLAGHHVPAFASIHRVGKVLSFSPVVGIGAPPTPHPQASVSPPLWFRGEGHTCWRERGRESPSSDDWRKAYHSAFSVLASVASLHLAEPIAFKPVRCICWRPSFSSRSAFANVLGLVLPMMRLLSQLLSTSMQLLVFCCRDLSLSHAGIPAATGVPFILCP